MYKFLLFVLLIVSFTEGAKKYRDLPIFNTTGPTVSGVYYAEAWATGSALIFTSAANNFFNPGSGLPDGGIYVIQDACTTVFDDSDTGNYDLVTADLPWTNDLEFIEAGSEVFGLSFPAIVGVSGRFPTAPRFALPSVPGKVFIIDVTTLPGTIHVISEEDPDGCEWYYQQFELEDINNDGRLDIVTVRVRDTECPPTRIFPPFDFNTEFVAFIQPENALDTPWALEILYDFDDAVNQPGIGFFTFVDIDNEIYGDDSQSTKELLYSSFSGSQSLIYYLGEGEEWLDVNKTVSQSIITDSLGAMYDIEVLDVNGDGAGDIVVTTHTTDEKAGMYVYEVTGNYRLEATLESIEHVIIDNLPVFGRDDSPLRLRPADFVVADTKGKKPVFALGTDGGGQLLLLTPKNGGNENNWQYDSEVLAEFGCDILAPVVYDINQTGKNELSVPCLSGEFFYTFTQDTGANKRVSSCD